MTLTNKFIETKTFLTSKDCHDCERTGHHCGGFVHENVDRYKQDIKEFTYISYKTIEAHEHEWTHNVKDIEDYYYNIPPVHIRDDGIYYDLLTDGNHRVNTLQKYKLDIPVYVIKEVEG